MKKKFAILNDGNLFAVEKNTIKEAEELAIIICDNSKEIIVREIKPIYSVIFTSMLKDLKK